MQHYRTQISEWTVAHFVDSAEGLRPDQLKGFFEGWADPPSLEQHLRLLHGSALVVLALDQGRVVGFVSAITDGVLSAYIPLLEVLPDYRGRGIGKELLSRMLVRLKDFYMVDLVCDENMIGFYEAEGLQPLRAMGRRNYGMQAGRP